MEIVPDSLTLSGGNLHSYFFARLVHNVEFHNKKGKITVEDAAEELGLDIPTTEKLLADNGIQVPSVV